MDESPELMTPWTPPYLWIGGSPCSGKSSIAALFRARFGFTVYSCDDAFHRHIKRVTPEAQPVLHRLANAGCDEIWMRPVEQQIAEELAIYREEFPLILDDLDNIHALPVLVEGAALLPELLAGEEIEPELAVWIVPTEEFQRREYARREWRHTVLEDCRDPDAAWENWMARDAGFARFVANQARELAYLVITVDGSRSIDEVYREVRAHVGL